MTLRDRVRRVFHRSSASRDGNNGRPKVEYYRRHEVPPSKFRGPFDKEHQKSLAAWSFDGAMMERTRSPDLALSPCATYDLPGPIDGLDETTDTTDDYAPDEGDSDPASDQDIADPRPTNTGSQSSTVVNSDSYSGSIMTLLNETSVHEISEDPIAQLKESIRYTSPVVRALTPVSRTPRTKGKHQPFSPEDLTRALIAVQVCA
ncbi:hypothetical protein N7532_012050 [Penicillium argentinense]|uniref:Uncharacterized protein n=1 Tax=Penicillium argentinense TaxID=1131581 RepID=A0A9W9EJL4_9EURO|nr:uncharacterized protein N7532_012050 [Penicillium argentinense]KAJ5083007.1 hypothetical protein N7532_012050 [Penicillium argentinense]